MTTVGSPAAPRAMWLSLPVGAGLLLGSYQIAQSSTSDGGTAKFVVFWFGLVAFLVPVTRRLANEAPSASERIALVSATSLMTMVPKLLRNPSRPIFYDELAHWVQTERLYETGKLFQPNPAVRVLPSFPGLHVLVDAVRHFTGLSTWQSAVVILTLIHVASAVGAFYLIRLVTGSDVIAGLGSLVWVLAPGAMFFNAQFAYQSLAIVGFVWALLLIGHTQRSRLGSPWPVTGLALLVCAAVILTHHLTSYTLTLCAVFVFVAALLARDRARIAPPATVFAVGAGALNALWMWARGGRRAVRSIVDYLSPYPSNGFDQLWGALLNSSERRQFFARSGLPLWERVAAFATPLLVMVLMLIGWSLMRRLQPKQTSFGWGMSAFGLLYFAALPLVLTPSGSQGAHRSFPFAYLGLAIPVGAGLAWLIRQTYRRGARFASLGRVAVTVAVIMLAVGNVAGNVNEYDRFPGPWEAGSDGRNLTAELSSSAEWMRSYESNDRIIADLYTGTAFGVLGSNRQSCAVAAACPGELQIWRFYNGQVIRESDLQQLRSAGYKFIVVDRRMASSTPRSGFWFNAYEQNAYEHTPYPRSALNRLESQTWLTKVSSSTSYEVYLINLDATKSKVLQGKPGAEGPSKPAKAAAPMVTQTTTQPRNGEGS